MEAVGAGRTIDDLPELARRLAMDESLRGVAESLRAGASGTIDGAWGSSKAMALAALAQSDRPLLVVVLPHAADVDPMVEDLRSFTGAAPITFPAMETMQAGADRSAAIQESFGRRLSVLKMLRDPGTPRTPVANPLVIVTTIHALLQPVPSAAAIRDASRTIERGSSHPLGDLLAWLDHRGWQRSEAVELPGQFGHRGGILDLFPLDAIDPLRIEFFGDEVESIREFSVQTQRSLRELDRVELTAMRPAPDRAGQGGDGRAARPVGQLDALDTHFCQAVPPGSWFGLVEPVAIREEAKQFLARMEDPRGMFSLESVWGQLLRWPTVTLSSLPSGSLETTCTLHVESVERFSGQVAKVRDELDGVAARDQLFVVCHNEAEVTRLGEVLGESRAAREGRLRFDLGHLAAGFRWVSGGVVVLSDAELFRRADQRRIVPRRRHLGRPIDSFLDLSDGEYVVHLGHGIGIFRGTRLLDKNGQLEEHLVVEFADRVLVYVPASKIDLVQRYVGSTRAAPKLSKIGGAGWERRKRSVQAAVQDLASDLLEVHAARRAQPGNAYPPDSEWLGEFEASFPFQETPDQLAARDAIHADLERPQPMDRLLCGDVGYGKTELAMRAAFKVVDAGKQVAVLVPTTVLAQQHLRTFRERMAEFPFVIECLSRFQSKREQRRIVQQAAQGSVEILIGTHRLLSEDIAFQDLGLVIIDEEQRFGVAHKERLKRLRRQVDVLTMTATPIPRTLHTALLGLRDISNLETPPEDRLAVETRITRFDPALVRPAILRELNRDGQIYFVHNRVQDIRRVADQLLRCVPEARVAIVHGQMDEEEIEEGMLAFLERRADILLATTIVESGLDIPNANTIFIDQGDQYGLADLHQLRGRVGRSAQRAYCYVLVDEHKAIRPDAQRRLKAIEEYSALGSGFHIALRDLEIRGAGNLLGPQQSGHIAAVGYELYCQLLENAVRTLNREPLRTILDVTIELPWKAYLPHDYLPSQRQRIETYRRLAVIREPKDLEDFRAELEDRFGPLPETVLHLVELARLRLRAHAWQVEAIRPDESGHLLLTHRHRGLMEKLANLRKGRIVVLDLRTTCLRVPRGHSDATSLAGLLERVLQPE